MKLVRFGPPGLEKPGVWMDSVSGRSGPQLLDVCGMAFDMADYDAHFFSHWGIERVRRLMLESGAKWIPAAGQRLGPPVTRPGKIICLGKNYADHAVEFDTEIPTSPILFSKAVTSIIGPQDPIRLPEDSSEIDAEVELALVIGKTARDITPQNAFDYIAGYCVLNDVTDRKAQREGGQWFRAKSSDSFCPVGPWLVTADEIADPHTLALRSRINGAVIQNGCTKDMIFKIPYLLSFISRTITLEPGDLIATGTPSGVGFARTPPVFLRSGDTVAVEIDGLGRLENPVASGV